MEARQERLKLTRSFVAVPVPEGHRSLLADYLEDCSRRAPRHRWVVPESLHLTLRFLGSVSDETLAAVKSGLAGIRFHPFSIELGEVGTFGGRAPRVVWLAVREGRGALQVMASSVEEACRAAGLSPQTRALNPHLTLARARDRRPAALPELAQPPRLPAWPATEFNLYESRLSAGGARYHVLETFSA